MMMISSSSLSLSICLEEDTRICMHTYVCGYIDNEHKKSLLECVFVYCLRARANAAICVCVCVFMYECKYIYRSGN